MSGSWFIFDIGFSPWFGWPFYSSYAYDYYPYSYPYYGYGYPYGGGYGYPYGYGYGYPGGYGYNSGAYDNYYPDQNGGGSLYYNEEGDDPSQYDRGSSNSYDRSGGGDIVNVQRVLAKEGYYRGQIDGVLGPATSDAIVRYQRDKGLEPSGSLTSETLRALGLQRLAED